MYRLRQLGYEIERGRSGVPEIKGHSQEYLDASSPRSRQIREHLDADGTQKTTRRFSVPLSTIQPITILLALFWRENESGDTHGRAPMLVQIALCGNALYNEGKIRTPSNANVRPRFASIIALKRALFRGDAVAVILERDALASLEQRAME